VQRTCSIHCQDIFKSTHTLYLRIALDRCYFVLRPYIPLFLAPPLSSACWIWISKPMDIPGRISTSHFQFTKKITNIGQHRRSWMTCAGVCGVDEVCTALMYDESTKSCRFSKCKEVKQVLIKSTNSNLN